MKGKYLKAIALCSLVSLGTVGLYGCASTTSSKMEILPTTGELNEKGQFDAKVNMTYTFKAVLDLDDTESSAVTWSSDSLADVQIVKIDDLTCEATFKSAGVFTIAASLTSDESISASLQVNVAKGQESYKLEIDTATAKITYVQGDKFSSEGLVVSRILFVDDVATSVSTTLTEEDYTLSINGKELKDGDILETADSFTVDVDANGITGSYAIRVVASEIYPFVKAVRSLANDNYTIGYASGNYLYSDRLISNDYVINYNLSEVYYNTSNGVKKYTVQSGEDETQTLSDSGYFYKDFVEPCTDVSEVNSLQGYVPASTYSESWLTEEHVGYYEQDNLVGYAIDQIIAEFFLNISGYRFATVNLDIQGGLFMISQFGDGSEFYEIYVFGTDGTGETQTIPVYILAVGTSFDETIENMVSECSTKTAVDGVLKSGTDAIGSGNFKVRTQPLQDDLKVYSYSEVTFTDDYYYQAYYNARKSDLSDSELDESYALCNINVNPDDPENLNVYDLSYSEETEGEFVFGEEPLAAGSTLFTNYKTIAYRDSYNEYVGTDYSYTIDPTHWVGFALPGSYDGTELEEYFKNGFYDYWNVEYYEYEVSGEDVVISSVTYAMYGEYAALDVMFGIFGMPYAYLQYGLGATYHSVTLTVNFDLESGAPTEYIYSVRITMPASGNTAMYKGLPLNWDSATLVATGDAARDTTVDAKIAEFEASLGVTA